MTLPPFTENVHYRELSPEEGKRRWRWATMRWTCLRLSIRSRYEVGFLDGNGSLWARIEGQQFWIAPNYWWNGCSPKAHVPLFGWVGTPDTPRTALASLFHDAMYQASGTDHFPFSREQADLIFRNVLRGSMFPFAGIYHRAVKEFGGASWGRPQGLYSKLL